MMRSLMCLALLLAAPLLHAADAPFLWQIQGAKTTHYLLGSVHLLPKSAYPLPPAIEAAYAASRSVVFESDLAELSSPQMQKKWLQAARAPKGLAAEISPALQQQLKDGGKTLKMPVDRCERFKAWFCAITLELYSLQRAGIEAEQGVDQNYFQRAGKDGKTILWLESPDDQLAVFASMPAGLSEQFLQSTLIDLSEPGRSAEDLVQQWLNGDVAGVERTLLRTRAEFPDIYSRMLSDRNRAWLPKLLKGFEGEEPLMIIVGAAHLAGVDGVPALLKARGIKIEPVQAVAP